VIVEQTTDGAIPSHTLCDDAIEELLKKNRGIVGASITGDHDGVDLTFDPRKTSEAEIRSAAESFIPAARRAFDKCTMRLSGRACEACALRLERKAEQIPGVRRARATFLGGVMSVTFDPGVLKGDSLLGEVRRTGAPVTPIGDAVKPEGKIEAIFTGLTLFFLVLGVLGERIGWPAPPVFGLYTLAYIAGGWFGVQASWQSIKERTIDVDLLMVLAALGAAFIGHPPEGATLLFLFSLSNVLQSHAIERTRRAIHALMQLRPESALVRRGPETILLPIDQVAVGELMILRPGDRVPLDGTVAEGTTSLDESSVTGESIPVSKAVGEPVFAGSINQSGGIEVRVTRRASDSTIARLIRLVEEAQTEKAQTQRWLDRAEQYYAVGVILFTAALATIPVLVFGQAFADAFYRAMTVMVVASPCALIISTPATILSAIGGAARRGVLFKGGAHLERTASVRTVVFDKTGTLTEGEPAVVAVEGADEREILRLAAAVESKSEHPLARSIVAAADGRSIRRPECSRFQSVAGQGASSTVEGRRIAVGNLRYFENQSLPTATRDAVERLEASGKTAVIVARIDGEVPEVIGVIGIADRLRPDVAEALAALHAVGVTRTVMLTGDNRHVAAAIAKEAGIDEFHAELRPEDKMMLVKGLRQYGAVAMVGDGVNDAPALASADVGIAMGAAGTDVAMESADVVLMSNNLKNVAFAVGLSRQARRVVFQNLAFALAVIVLLVVSALGIDLPLTLGVVGHEGSTVLVCLNGLRLLGYRGT
jgi:Cd2+/Zn2+-exporting ATPase